MRFSLGLLCSLVVAQAKDVVENWDIGFVTTNRGLDQPARKSIGVNGQFPLPVVEAVLGDTLILNVRNSLDVPTSLHAHGIHQFGTNYYDGVYMVTECGVAPGSNFTYEIPLMQAGTYWIHGHTSEQNYDGLQTTLIVYNPNDTYSADCEYLFVFEDWWPLTFMETYPLLTEPNPTAGLFDSPPGMLINGANANLTGPIDFVAGNTYRIRLVSMSSFPLFEFTIDDHELQIIEVDGVATKPYNTSVVRLAPAERTSVLVTAKETTTLNYQYHVTMFGDFLPAIPGVFPSTYNGSVVYDADAPFFEVETIATGFLDELAIESLDDEPALVPDHHIYLNATSGFHEDGSTFESFNQITYKYPLVPSILSALTTGDMATSPITYGPDTNTHVLKYGEIIEMLLWSPTNLPHPIHLHGHVFQIIEKGFTNDTTGQYRNQVPATNAPLKRDTIFIPGEEYAIVRFRANNPGLWSLHCHITWHSGMGLIMLFASAPEMMQESVQVPDAVLEQCRLQGILTSGNAAGNNGGFNYAAAPNDPYLLVEDPLSN
ncbi:ferroxidase fet3 [Coemansia sp. RSA 1822]|nr:ferroxidase fet3 [Coemansia sp. RSA 638]KAJ2121066.1 ferroxidase fet3 [Coemansia sp. RSA 720]KAJ2542456.1 ferroxidase fet3 [Coemansia sp. RSA 1853]KAJ2561489.1 ferroxidase fet3 [Coemansia sp. RSA 1822]